MILRRLRDAATILTEAESRGMPMPFNIRVRDTGALPDFGFDNPSDARCWAESFGPGEAPRIEFDQITWTIEFGDAIADVWAIGGD